MNIVVVGGGIVGLSSAHALASRGGDVVVCEKGSIGSGSTERSAGGIRAQFSTRVNVDLSLESIARWETFEERFETSIDYRRPGYLFLARTEETVTAFEEALGVQNERGVPSELLEPADALEYCQGIHPDRFLAATYSPTGGFADPHLALQGYADAAVKEGVEIRTQTPVIDVLRAGDRDAVIGVETDSGRLEADFVVNAAGPWARRIGRLAGVELPIAPKRRQMAVVDPEAPVPERDPLTIDHDSGAYFRPERDGDALVGGHFADAERRAPAQQPPVSGSHSERNGPRATDTDPDCDPDTYGKSIDFEWTAAALETVSEWTTYFGPGSGVKRGWAGLYAVTPDHHAIVDETVPGLITASGFSGHGFQHAPATGELVAELVFDGEASLVDISDLSSDRFDAGDDRVERNVV